LLEEYLASVRQSKYLYGNIEKMKVEVTDELEQYVYGDGSNSVPEHYGNVGRRSCKDNNVKVFNNRIDRLDKINHKRKNRKNRK